VDEALDRSGVKVFWMRNDMLQWAWQESKHVFGLGRNTRLLALTRLSILCNYPITDKMERQRVEVAIRLRAFGSRGAVGIARAANVTRARVKRSTSVGVSVSGFSSFATRQLHHLIALPLDLLFAGTSASRYVCCQNHVILQECLAARR
jgi:hypothetical protein